MINKTGAVVAGLLVVSLGIGSTLFVQQTKQQPVSNKATAITAAPLAQKQTDYAADDTTQVLIDAPAVSADEIVKIIKHGDHWHVFTKDGREIITYSDPTKAGSAANLKNTASVLSGESLKLIDPNTVVRLLKHGNHWHIFTAGGSEYISYTDPRPYYPNATVGTYEGNHGTSPNYGNGSNTGSTHQTGGQINPDSSSQPGGGLPGNPGLHTISVVTLDELRRLPITKILRHADHWHCYTADNTEYITKDNPASAFPGIVIGEYSGTDTPGGHPEPQPPVGPIRQDPNDPKRVVRIEHHEDHWHLHHADGTESITREDPSRLYPDITIEEYDPNNGHILDPLIDGEKFSYDEIEPKLAVDIKSITYGNLVHSVRFDRERDAFVIPHYDHYHYVSLQTIIQCCKDSYFAQSFGNASARDVVATIKYLIAHPEARPKGENGWGSDASVDTSDTSDTPATPNTPDTHDNTNDAGTSHSNANTKKPTRIIEEANNIWLVYYEDSSTQEFSYDPSSKWPGVKVEKATHTKPNGDMTQEEIIAKWSKIYGMTQDEFEDAFLALPYTPMEEIIFNTDGTVIVHGKTYQFKPLAEKPKAEASKEVEKPEATEAPSPQPKDETAEKPSHEESIDTSSVHTDTATEE